MERRQDAHKPLKKGGDPFHCSLLPTLTLLASGTILMAQSCVMGFNWLRNGLQLDLQAMMADSGMMFGGTLYGYCHNVWVL